MADTTNIQPHLQPRKRPKQQMGNNKTRAQLAGKPLDGFGHEIKRPFSTPSVLVSHSTVYNRFAALYNELAAKQDNSGTLTKTLEDIGVFSRSKGGLVVDCGAGTGKLAEMVLQNAHSVIACDRSSHMCGIAKSWRQSDLLCRICTKKVG